MYAIESVDSALLLATLLQHEEPMRVTDVAQRLGVSVSTAHRLLGMLVYRDFAEQLPDRRYGAGPALCRGAVQPASVTRLREVALPHLRRLAASLGETANLMGLVAPDVRFIATVECEQVLRVGDRTGRSLPAHRASGGKAILATMDRAQLTDALNGIPDGETTALARELRGIQRCGFAVNDQQTEAGLTAVGVAVAPTGALTGVALSIAAPTARVIPGTHQTWAAALHHVGSQIASELDTRSRATPVPSQEAAADHG